MMRMTSRLIVLGMLLPLSGFSGCMVQAAARDSIERPNPALLGIVAVDTSHGTRIAEVISDSPAVTAGLHSGDQIIRVAGKRVARSDDIDRALAGSSPGDQVAIQVIHDGTETKVNARLTERDSFARTHLKRVAGSQLLGQKAPPWIAQSWDGLRRGQSPPAIDSLQGKIVVFHCFQSW